MADPQDLPEGQPDQNPPSPAKKQPAKKAAKAPAKKAPAKKAPAKKAPAKKAPADQPPAKKAPAASPESAPPTLADEILGVQHRAETNGQLAAAAKDAAAQAKSTVERANDPLPREVTAASALQSPVPLVVAIALSLLAILLVRQLRRG